MSPNGHISVTNTEAFFKVLTRIFGNSNERATVTRE